MSVNELTNDEDETTLQPKTVPLEQMSLPPQLATTLEHIVGQLDVLTQVKTALFFCLNK